jgi:hypothetical protein
LFTWFNVAFSWDKRRVGDILADFPTIALLFWGFVLREINFLSSWGEYLMASTRPIKIRATLFKLVV